MFEAALGGARLDPLNRLTLQEALVPRRTAFGGAGLNPLVSPSREAVRGAKLNPMRPVPGSETEPPGFSAGIPGKSDTESIVTRPQGGWKGFGAPGLKVFTLHCILAAGLGMWAQLAISCRRCHDHGHSGWAILVGLIPIIGIVFFIYLGFIKGKDEPNQYGPSPY